MRGVDGDLGPIGCLGCVIQTGWRRNLRCAPSNALSDKSVKEPEMGVVMVDEPLLSERLCMGT